MRRHPHPHLPVPVGPGWPSVHGDTAAAMAAAARADQAAARADQAAAAAAVAQARHHQLQAQAGHNPYVQAPPYRPPALSPHYHPPHQHPPHGLPPSVLPPPPPPLPHETYDQQQQQAQEVIAIDDSDFEVEERYAMGRKRKKLDSSGKRKKKKRHSHHHTSKSSGKAASKKRSAEERTMDGTAPFDIEQAVSATINTPSIPLPPPPRGYTTLVAPSSTHTAAATAKGVGDWANPIAGDFVNGVVSGELLDRQLESNQQRAVENINFCATGYYDPPPPETVTFNQRQVHLLAKYFVEDRNNAVQAAVQAAQEEMQANHDEDMEQQHQKQKWLEERAKQAASAAAFRPPPSQDAIMRNNDQQREDATKYKLNVEIKHLRRAMQAQAEEKDTEIATLKRHLQQVHHKGIRDRERQAAMAQTESEQVASLKEKIKYMEGRQKRSISAIMQASVHSLRLLQSKSKQTLPLANTNGDSTDTPARTE